MDDYEKWLDCSSEKISDANNILANTSPNYRYYAVSTAVNNARNEGGDLIQELH